MRIYLLICLLDLSFLGFAQTGDTIYYYKSGEKESEGKLDKGMKDGRWIAYYKSGSLKIKGNYSKGKAEGLWEFYYENGVKNKAEFYQNGKVGGSDYTYSGKNYVYYENGNVKEEYTWLNGKLHGLQKQLYSDGSLKKKVNCEEGLYNGMMTEYYSNGKIKSEAKYVKGKAVHPFRNYDSTGVVINEGKGGIPVVWKPVIYLYPEQETDVKVNMEYNGKLLFTYPEYRDGWIVKAMPDGRLINEMDKQEYSYLFWEGQNYNNFLEGIDVSKGFIVSGENSQAFLQKTFADIGLLPKEYNELLVFWLPKMIENKYNYIYFLINEEYDSIARLKVKPEPDALLRVFLIFQALNQEINLTPQNLPHFKRKGFSVVEWGGAQTESLISEF